MEFYLPIKYVVFMRFMAHSSMYVVFVSLLDPLFKYISIIFFLVSIVMNFVNLGTLMFMENTNVDVICSSYLARGKNGLFIFLA
jgi:hypothetical protein